MRQPQFSGKPPFRMVVDTSVIINLNATGVADVIIKSLDVVLSASVVVKNELLLDRLNGRHDAELAQQLIRDGLLQFAEFDEESEAIFESLVNGPAEATLDDGEAATLALAVSSQSVAIIDERKAMRIAEERFPALDLLTTADLLRSGQVLSTLGNDGVANAVLNGLKGARMAIPERHHNWVVEILGEEILECRSLPAALRRPSA